MRPTYPYPCHFLLASLLQSDHPTPHIAFSSSPFGRPGLRHPLAKWSGLGPQLHVFASAPAAGQIFYITSLGFLPQQDRGQRCASMGLARPSPPAFFFPGMGSSPRGTLSNLSILWLQARGGRILISIKLPTPSMHSARLPVLLFREFSASRFGLHSNSCWRPLAWHKLPFLALALHCKSLRLNCHLPRRPCTSFLNSKRSPRKDR